MERNTEGERHKHAMKESESKEKKWWESIFLVLS